MERWFEEQLLPKLCCSIIVMDNAPFHCRKRGKLPTIKMKKNEIMEWLQSKNIEYPASNENC